MKISMVLDGTVSAEIRLESYAAMMRKRGNEVIVVQAREIELSRKIPSSDVAILSRPHNWNIIEIYKEHSTKVIVDIDDDFWSIPRTHVAYPYVGPGNKQAIEDMSKCLSLADTITTSTTVLAERLERFGHPVHVVKNGWDDTNNYWRLPKRKLDKQIIIGWAGTITHREDFAPVVPALLEITRRYPDVGILIGSDLAIYQMMHRIPESSKWFFPMMPYHLYPTLFRYIDIWLAPLIIDKFNEAKSDIKLVEGSVRGIPAIVSPAPAYLEWGDNVLYARDTGEWIKQLDFLVQSEDSRKRLGMRQFDIANQRTMSSIVDKWLEVLQ